MFEFLKRHPIPIQAHFRHSLVLTYALPREILEPLLPPGLTVDAHGDFGFVAIALVQTEGLRPAPLPAFLGQRFFLTGYRIFARYTTPAGRRLRGLRILRSDTDRPLMAFFGNLLTHYNYRVAKVEMREEGSRLSVRITTPGAEADLSVTAELGGEPAPLPEGSPFADLREARRFAGPLPFTFDYESGTHSIVRIEGVRSNWNPQPVRVDVERCTFFDHPPFNQTTPVLANAFHIQDIPYRWKRGVVEPLPAATERRETAGERGAFAGAAQILRYNRHLYGAALGVAGAALATPRFFPGRRALRAASYAGAGLALFWSLGSLVISHLIYDRSPLGRWGWIAPLFPAPPARWISIHAGLDESSPALRRLFPEGFGGVYDMFDPREMTEPSIARARGEGAGASGDARIDYRALPLAPASLDAVFLIFAAHEIRGAAGRAAFFRELGRVVAPGGRLLLVEHLRDMANFVAFGPGFLHFLPRREWLRLADLGGFTVERERTITRFVTALVLRRAG